MPSVFTNAATPMSENNLFGLNATTGFTVAFWVKNIASLVVTAFEQSGASTTRDGYSVQFRSSASEAGLYVNIFGSAGNTATVLGLQYPQHLDGKWNHYAVTFDDANNLLRGYRNGNLISSNTNTRDMTANGTTCRTRIFPSIVATYVGFCFDLQVLPDVIVPGADIPLLMKPGHKYPGVKGRWFGLDFQQTTAGNKVYDESGNGNNVTVAAGVTMYAAEEPPFRPTFA